MLVAQIDMYQTDNGSTLANIGCGFTCVGPNNSATSSGQNLDYICYKSASGSESGTCQFGANGAIDSAWMGAICDYGQGFTASQFDGSIGNNSDTSGATLTAPSVTPSVCNDELVGAFTGFVNGNSLSGIPATGFTPLYNSHVGGYIAQEAMKLTSCSATSTFAATASGNTHWSADSILLKASP
jgi:hypothetical protein